MSPTPPATEEAVKHVAPPERQPRVVKGLARRIEQERPIANRFLQARSNAQLIQDVNDLGIDFDEKPTRKLVVTILKKAIERALHLRITHNVERLQGKPTGEIKKANILARISPAELLEDLKAGVIAKISQQITGSETILP